MKRIIARVFIVIILICVICMNVIEAKADTIMVNRSPYIVPNGPASVAVKIIEADKNLEILNQINYYSALDLLAVCVEAEAGNQGLTGKRLVCDVILNRVDSDQFPNDIVSVISDSGQFSSYFNGAMDSVIEPSEETFLAIQLELDQRLDYEILYFTAGRYNEFCIPAYKYGDHYFGY